MESRLLWGMGQAVHRYVERVFDAGILCPFQGAPEDAPQRSESGGRIEPLGVTPGSA